MFETRLGISWKAPVLGEISEHCEHDASSINAVIHGVCEQEGPEASTCSRGLLVLAAASVDDVHHALPDIYYTTMIPRAWLCKAMGHFYHQL